MAEKRDKQSMGNKTTLDVSYTLRGQNNHGYGSQGTGWFGPSEPMSPSAPPTVKGRILDYTSGYNLHSRIQRSSGITFDQLRKFADSYDLLRLVIETRKDQIAALNWNIVPRSDSGVDAKDEKALARAKEIKAFFRRPDKDGFWDEWLRMILEDLLVLDAPAIYRRLTYGGDLYSLQPIDGGTIKRVIDVNGNTPEAPHPAYQQILKGLPAVDYSKEELLYRPRNKRTNQIYGFSPVEQIVMTINIALRRQTWQLQSFTEGNIPEALIGTPDGWTPDQIASFQGWFDNALEGDTGARRRARFVPGAIAKGYVPTKPSELFGEAEEWLARVVCYAFSVSPQALLKMMNRATAETAQETAQLEGLAPVMRWVKSLVDIVIEDDFHEPDLEFKWIDEDELDPNVKSQIVDREHSAGRLTFNEARAEGGLDPIDHPDADRPMMKTATGWVPIFKTPEEIAEAEAMRAQIAGEEPQLDEDGNPVEPETDEDGNPLPPKPGKVPPQFGKSDNPDDLEKKHNSSQPRHDKGSSKGGQFASSGSGSSASEFGDSDAHSAISGSSITKEQQEVLDDYTHVGYETVNSGLRDGSLSSDHQATVDTLDSLMDGSRADKETVVYRGLSDSRGQKMEEMVGNTYRDDAFVSTSSNPQVASSFTFSDSDVQYVMEVKIPKGNRALSVANVSKNNHEEEVILPRGSGFKITGVSTVQHGRDTLRVIHVEHLDGGGDGG